MNQHRQNHKRAYWILKGTWAFAFSIALVWPFIIFGTDPAQGMWGAFLLPQFAIMATYVALISISAEHYVSDHVQKARFCVRGGSKGPLSGRSVIWVLVCVVLLLIIAHVPLLFSLATAINIPFDGPPLNIATAPVLYHPMKSFGAVIHCALRNRYRSSAAWRFIDKLSGHDGQACPSGLSCTGLVPRR